MSDVIPLFVAQKRLTLVWFVGAFLILGLMLARMLLQDAFTCEPDVPSCDPRKPWEWWASAVLPTLLLMGGTITALPQESRSQQLVNLLAYRLALWISVFYLLVSLLPVVTPNVDTAVALDRAKWIPALQGLVALFIGRLFGSVQSKE